MHLDRTIQLMIGGIANKFNIGVENKLLEFIGGGGGKRERERERGN